MERREIEKEHRHTCFEVGWKASLIRLKREARVRRGEFHREETPRGIIENIPFVSHPWQSWYSWESCSGFFKGSSTAPRVDTRISLPYGGRNLCILVNKKKKTESRRRWKTVERGTRSFSRLGELCNRLEIDPRRRLDGREESNANSFVRSAFLEKLTSREVRSSDNWIERGMSISGREARNFCMNNLKRSRKKNRKRNRIAESFKGIPPNVHVLR